MQFEDLLTPRLILRKLTPGVYDYIYANLPDEDIIAFLGLTSQEMLDEEKAKHSSGLTKHDISFLHFLLIDKFTMKPIGGCGYHTWFTEHYRAEIGYGLTDDVHKGKGLMYEAIIPIIDYGFGKMGLLRIEAMASPDNAASVNLLEKCGFVREGLLRKNYYDNGMMTDSILFSLLPGEQRESQVTNHL